MKTRYLSLGLIQLFLIFISGWLRRASWREIDFGSGAGSLSLQVSFFCLAGWLAAIAIAIWFAVFDKTNRAMVVLFLVLLLPWVEFFVWFSLSY